MGYQEEKKWHNEQEDCIVTLHPVPDLESYSNIDQIKIHDHNEEHHIATHHWIIISSQRCNLLQD